MIKAVVFDLDDTLAPEKSFVKSGYGAVEKALGADNKGAASELWQLFLQDSVNVFNRYFESHHIEYTVEDIRALVKIYREHEIDTDIYEFYDDVLPCFDMLRKKNIMLGVLSDGFLVSQQHKVKALALEEKVDEIMLTDALGKEYWKPSSKGFLMLCEHFKIDPEEMLYIGDNPKKDFCVKKEIPIKTARIMRKDSVYEAAEYMDGIKEDYALSSLLCETLERICRGEI